MLETNFTPFPELKTKRLLLRRIKHDDIDQILLLRSNNEVMRFIDKERAKTIEDAEIFLKTVDDSLNNGNGILWGISFSEQPGLITGYIGYWRLVKEHYRAEVGYTLLPEYWKKGFMKEALTKLITYGFDTMKLHSIEARIDPDNKASASLLLSTGFQKEGYFKEDYFFKGKFGDTEVYSRLHHNNL